MKGKKSPPTPGKLVDGILSGPSPSPSGGYESTATDNADAGTVSTVTVGNVMKPGEARIIQPIRTIKKSPLPDVTPQAEPAPRPKCGVGGRISPNAMCGHVITGLVYCGFSGYCEHKKDPPAPTFRPALDFDDGK